LSKVFIKKYLLDNEIIRNNYVYKKDYLQSKT